MRTLNVAAGIGVLFSTVAYGHLIHHYIAGTIREPGVAQFWIGIGVGILAGVLSFIGGCLLILRKH